MRAASNPNPAALRQRSSAGPGAGEPAWARVSNDCVCDSRRLLVKCGNPLGDIRASHRTHSGKAAIARDARRSSRVDNNCPAGIRPPDRVVTVVRNMKLYGSCPMACVRGRLAAFRSDAPSRCDRHDCVTCAAGGRAGVSVLRPALFDHYPEFVDRPPTPRPLAQISRPSARGRQPDDQIPENVRPQRYQREFFARLWRVG